MTTPLFAAFCLFAAVTLGFALYRQIIVRFKTDDCLHLTGSADRLIEMQSSAARRLQMIDMWGKAFTVVTVACGFAAYAAWWLGA